jgi:Tfp pilus assembly protein PilO
MARTFLTLLFLITAVALFFVKTQPYFDDISGLKADKQKYEEALASSRELQTLKNGLLSQYNAIPQEDIERLNKLLPSRPDSGSLIAMAENRALSRGLLLRNMDAREEPQPSGSSALLGMPLPPYKIINLSFSVSGPYASALAFFSDLGQSLRLVDMNAVGFTSGPVDNYQFDITAKTYYAVPSVPSLASGAGSAEGGQEILTMLTKLRAIKIDSEFFKGNIFKSLVDFVPVLEMPQEYGRPNPFAPLK